jgi:hypothetical protein
MKKQTIEDLKSIGFHGKNFIEVKLPSFFYDPVNRKVIESEEAFQATNQLKLESHVVKTTKLYDNLGENMESGLFRMIYNAKIVAWYPCEQPPLVDGKQFVLLQFSILEQ